MLLLIGNGPSSWWIRPHHIDELREERSDIVVAACNRTGSYLSAHVTGAVDRGAIEELLDAGVYHSHKIVVEQEAFAAILRDRGEAPAGLADGWNLFFFARGDTNEGTGVALASALCGCLPSGVFLIGFDGENDSRTRWQGTRGYKNRTNQAPILERWRKRVVDEVIGPNRWTMFWPDEALHGIPGAKPSAPRRVLKMLHWWATARSKESIACPT